MMFVLYDKKGKGQLPILPLKKDIPAIDAVT
jgi:hypothetical protein